jgi:osmotically-inducible protein OsmY
MKFIKRAISARWVLIFSVVVGCQTITKMTRVESPKDAAISKAVKEKLVADKTVDLTRIDVETTDGAVDLSGVVASLEAREHALKLAWQVTGVQAVVNHLQIEK